MPKSTLTKRLQNLARGGENYRNLRWRVFTAMGERPGQSLSRLTPYLSGTFFTLSQERFGENTFPLHALPMMTRDWHILSQLAGNNDETIGNNYLRLVSVIENKALCARIVTHRTELKEFLVGQIFFVKRGNDRPS
jgi:hypothetical protein